MYTKGASLRFEHQHQQSTDGQRGRPDAELSSQPGAAEGSFRGRRKHDCKKRMNRAAILEPRVARPRREYPA